ncbi:NAD(P)-binding protein [Streptomyces sp. CB03234]|uniref:NAD(P)-binding protein n=1 Tax=Streptomyces sp. (strain CB03234) TaxID=1703937 RepID=UPI001F525276|nr:NAD(P)-binding protein [Streptomyces sp. CB03234]
MVNLAASRESPSGGIDETDCGVSQGLGLRNNSTRSPRMADEEGHARHAEVVVVGAGMFGSAAAKYLSRAGADVVVIGPGSRTAAP